MALAKAIMSPEFQSAFNVVKGSVPARTDVPDTDFDACGKKGIERPEGGDRVRQALRLDGARPRAPGRR